ncbi:hypothetical protein FSP39_009773 [Pinctada imbricata]|uniref:Uncharacterized protein n=1 Tax=Pinctada imbricata TaxID=66713 RepID=A0AA89CC08_PINIB|nr:hypothetical protein FSP39_009773 [Pinctada imbricata]
MERPTVLRMRLRVAYSVMGILIGLSVLLVFGLRLNNWNAALWGLMSGCTAAITLTVHICYLRGVWETRYGSLKFLMLFGCFIQLIGVCGFVVYLTLAIVNKQGLIIEGNGYYLTCVWCFMTWKWGFLLLMSARRYKKLYQGEYSLISEYSYGSSKSYYSTS